MNIERHNQKAAAAIAGSLLGLGVLGVGAYVSLEHAVDGFREQFAQGFAATYYGHQPAIVSHAAPFKEEVAADTGPTVGDYVVPGAIVLVELGAAGYVLRRYGIKKPEIDRMLPIMPESCSLSLAEVQAFDMIVAREFKQS